MAEGAAQCGLVLEAHSEGTAISWCSKLEDTSPGTADNRRNYHLTPVLVSEELNKHESSSLPCD